MFWTLTLAHLIADYPLLPDRLLRFKRTWAGLGAHVTLHLLIALTLVGSVRSLIWPYLVLLAALHFVIDVTKALLEDRSPRWVVGLYLGDQAVHLATIALVAQVIELRTNIDWNRSWAVYGAGYLFVTYVWYITERVLAQDNEQLRLAIQVSGFRRMIVRALLLTFIVSQLHLKRPFLAAFTGAVFLTVMLGFHYRTHENRWRMLLLDLFVPLFVALFLLPAIGP